ncbi:MAG: NAD(P)H-dependent oxidoreductase subunit E [Chloroflexota bacterium]
MTSDHAGPIEAVLRPYQGRKGVLLEVFHRVQEEYGYVPQSAMEPIAKLLNLHPSTVYGSLTFYTEFRTSPPPGILIGMCLGPTCHIRGAEIIREILQRRLGLSASGDTEDNSCGIHVIQCAGHCQHAPLVYVNGAARREVTVGGAAALADEVAAALAQVER